MKNNKGFTLVEIISVIGILVIIALVTVPNIISINKNNKEKNYEKTVDLIITSAENYYHNNIKLGNLTECYITLQEIVNKKLIKAPIINPITNQEIPLTTYVLVKKETVETGSTKITYKFITENVENPVMCPTEITPSTPDGSPNKPVLADGMIPVVYSDANNTWKVADKTSNWYNYDELKWANAVTVTSGSRSEYLEATPGTEISMDDITTMWVWIPRYKYKRSNRIGLDYEYENPSQIDVVFENGTDTTGEGYEKYADIYETGQDVDYYFTHPAFTFGGEELTGFWASKFEIGYNEAMFKTGFYIPNASSEYFDGDEYVIKPDVSSLCSVGKIGVNEVGIEYPEYDTNYIKTLFKASLAFAGGKINGDGSVVFKGNDRYGLTSNNDTHLMKLYDWSAVAYLSNSQYGKSANSSYSDKNKEIYFNNSTAAMTGRSAGAPAGSFTVNQSFCVLEECGSVFDDRLSHGYYTYNNIQHPDSNEYYNMGTGASTTGTIYGVYDMVGGCQEFAINSNTFSNLDQKYYENNTLNKSFGIATSETSSWYNDSYEEGFCGGGGARITYDSDNSYDSRYGVFQPPCIDGVNYSYEYSADFGWIYDAPNKIGGHAVLIP